MSMTCDFALGSFHLCMRVKGSPAKIELFHHVMKRIESSWPWHSTILKHRTQETYIPGVRVCETCCGAVLSSPRITPQDIKIVGKQCGVKVKVDRMASDDQCRTSTGMWSPIPSVPQPEGRRLYQHKASRLRIEDDFVLMGNETVKDRRAEIVEKPRVIHLPAVSQTVQ